MSRIPLSTYRIQFNPGFGFRKACDIVEYLFLLGISDLYASPVFQARKGSTHGYDIIDPTQLNAELGDREDLEALSGCLWNRGMGWIQDIVPNHVAVSRDNPYLRDLFENGSCSGSFGAFDIEWDYPSDFLRNRCLAPFLGRLYGEALENGEIKVQFSPEGFSIKYYDLELPLKIESYLHLIDPEIDRLKGVLGEDHPDFIKFVGTAHTLRNLPASAEKCTERGEQVLFVKRMLWELYRQNDQIKKILDKEIAALNGEPGMPESFNRLDSLLAEQNFRLSFWKVASEEINYRRFFNINDLITLRMEEDGIFDQMHGFIFDLLKNGIVTGLRVDHIDGLYDPTVYLKRLRERAGEDAYIVVEKILMSDENLPDF